MKSLLIMISVSVLLMSCTAQTNTSDPPVFTSSNNPTVGVTALPVSTSTIATTPMPTITRYPTYTKEPTETSNPVIATREAALDSCRGNSPDRLDKYIFQAYSSNNEWNAIICQDNGIYTKVSSLNKGIVWNISPIDTDEAFSGPEWFLEPYLWSDNGHYLYLTPKFLGFIDSPWLIYSSGFGLSRLDLYTGRVDTWLKPNDGGYSFAFTPDGKFFAYSPEIPRMVKIKDLISGQEENLSFKENYAILEFRWTPDGSRLVIFTEESASDKAQSGFSIFVYNVKSEVLKKLVDKNNLKSSFPTEEFVEPRIYIDDLSNEVLFLADIFQENYFKLNIRTGELVQVDKLMTPTPTPQ